MIKRLNNQSDFERICKKIGVSKGGIPILKNKSNLYYFYIKDLKTPACNILKQDLLSIGADVAVSNNTINCKDKTSDALMVLNKKQLNLIIKKLKIQPYGLKVLSYELQKFLIHHEFETKIMGIINANDDSFFEDSRFLGKEAINKIISMIEDGANIIDIGGVSSRPGSDFVSEEEELRRIKPIIDELYKLKFYEKIDFSLDSYSPLCVEYALDRGFKIINDITALENEEVAKLVAKYDATVVLMHKKGTPKDMQKNPFYEDVILEIDDFFENRIDYAKSFGIKKIVLDVGIGFGKRLEDNLNLINHLVHFTRFGYELLVGASRKSMIDMIYKTPVELRLPGTLAIHQEAIKNGASIIRCHDVKEHKQMIEVLKAISRSIG